MATSRIIYESISDNYC